MFLYLFLGFLPHQGALPSGPPAPHLDADPFVQGRLSRRPDWEAFQAAFGGDWYVRWDERNGTPRFLGAPGVPAAQADALVAAVAALGGVDAGDLHLTHRSDPQQPRQIWRWTRTWRGAEVVGDQIALVLTGGQIGAVWVQLTPIAAGDPLPGEVIFPLPDRGYGVLATREARPERVRYLDRAGRTVHQYDPRLYTTIQMTAPERTPSGADVTVPARQITVTDTTGASEVTDDAGGTSLTGDLDLSFIGPSLEVTISGALVTASGADDTTLVADIDVSRSATSVQHHTHVVRDWLVGRWPEHAWLSERVYADAYQATGGSCNAWYSSGTINFLPGYGVCSDAGEVADVIYHEFGHGVHDYILEAGTFASDVSEGSADFVAATLLGTAYVAPDFYPPGSAYLRELDTDKIYPTDTVGEPHNDGLIWGSFLWNLRQSWAATYGETDGVALTDALFLGALQQGPAMTDLAEAVLVADDDDGDWSNGTPHDCELMALLDHHGLLPGALGVVSVDLQPLGPQPSDATSYTFGLGLDALSASCSYSDPPTLAVYTTADDALEVHTTATGWTGWDQLPLSCDSERCAGALDRLPANSHVRWFAVLTSADGTETWTSHKDEEDRLEGFWVGDRATVWCDDLEGDTSAWTHDVGLPWIVDPPDIWVDQWAFGAPSGATWKPDAPTSGAVLVATGLDDEYTPDNQQYLMTPPLDLSGAGQMRLLSYQRWLTVEDGLYDQAEILAWRSETTPSETFWNNPSTEAGSTSFTDADWTLHDLALDDWLAAGDSRGVRFLWTLRSDHGLEFGGWALDDVCVVELDDRAGHYRADDLRATDANDAVTVTWSVPWVQPILGMRLVRTLGGLPLGPDDGEVVLEEPAVDWGDRHTWLDYDTAPGEVWGYAVYFQGADGWFTDTVSGENADLGGVPSPADEVADTADLGGASVPLEEAPKEERCGCAQGRGGEGIPGLLLALGLAARRRGRAR